MKKPMTYREMLIEKNRKQAVELIDVCVDLCDDVPVNHKMQDKTAFVDFMMNAFTNANNTPAEDMKRFFKMYADKQDAKDAAVIKCVLDILMHRVYKEELPQYLTAA